MTDTPLLICGAGFSEAERAALGAIRAAQAVPGPHAIADLAPGMRQQVRAVALKGHAAFGAAQMDLLPGLGLVANYGVGVDAIDLDAARMRDVAVSNTPDVLNDDVADLAVGLLIAQFRDLVAGDGWVRSGRWAAEGAPPLARTLTGARVGIVGLGRIGREIADRLAAMKMEVRYFSRREKATPGWPCHARIVDLARAVDVLVVSLVGGEATRGAVSAEVLDGLGQGGVVVNISRGSTIDEEALIARLADGRLAGAALDVFASEPDVDPRLAALDGVVLQPHRGSATVATRQAMADLQVANLRAFFDGRTLPSPVS